MDNWCCTSTSSCKSAIGEREKRTLSLIGQSESACDIITFLCLTSWFFLRWSIHFSHSPLCNFYCLTVDSVHSMEISKSRVKYFYGKEERERERERKRRAGGRRRRCYKVRRQDKIQSAIHWCQFTVKSSDLIKQLPHPWFAAGKRRNRERERERERGKKEAKYNRCNELGKSKCKKEGQM